MDRTGVWSIAFHDNGHTLAAGSGSGQILVFDLKAGDREMMRISKHADEAPGTPVHLLAFSRRPPKRDAGLDDAASQHDSAGGYE